MTRLHGRTELVDRVLPMLARPGIVTLLGPPGVGKSTVLGALAKRIREAEPGRPVRWLDDQIAEEIPSRPDDNDDANSATLWLLDGLTSPGDDLRQQASELARAGDTVLVGCLEPLDVAEGEHVTVDPLDPDRGFDLFAEHWGSASLTEPEQATARNIVASLDGVPGALVAAAQWCDVLSLHDLAKRLFDQQLLFGGPAPHSDSSSFRAAMEKAWDAVGESEQRALATASVFAGPFDIAAAEAVLDDHCAAPLLRSLHRLNLVESNDGPSGIEFRLLAPVRAFAALKLADLGLSDDARSRHSHYFAQRVAGEDHLESLTPWSRDLLAALAYMVEVADEQSADLAEPIATAAMPQIPTHELEPILCGVADLSQDAGPEMQARVLLVLGIVQRRAGRVDDSIETLERGEALCTDALLSARLDFELGRALGNATRTAAAMHRLARAADRFGQLADRSRQAAALAELAAHHAQSAHWNRAKEILEQALAVQRIGGDRVGEAETLMRLGTGEAEFGRLDSAKIHLESALAIYSSLQRLRDEARARSNLGLLCLQAEDHATARNHGRRALEAHRQLGLRRSEGIVLSQLALVEHDAEQLDEAAQLYRESLALHRQVENHLFRALVLQRLGILEFERGSNTQAEVYLQEALDTCASDNTVGERPLATAYLGLLRWVQGEKHRAEQLFADARRMAVVDPVLQAAVQVLGSIGRGGPSDFGLPVSHETRLAVRVVHKALAGALAPIEALAIGAHGRWFRAPSQCHVDLSSRPSLASVLDALAAAREVHNGKAVATTELISAGWPGERPMNDSGASRVYVAVATLRKLGLGSILQTAQGGYRLDPQVPLLRR